MAKVESKKRGGLSQDKRRGLYREMLLIRRFEEKVEERFRAGELSGFLHVAIGQEAVAVGVCQAMADGDVFASTHRAHAHALARGMHPNALMAELYGKTEGCSHGYGGSMHLYDVEIGFLGANAVVGGGLPAITGAALAFKLRKEPRVAVAFFGDGATNIGTFHESLNLAQLWQVPAVYVCENNHYAESTPASQQLPIKDLAKRAVAFGMHSITVDGQDVEEVLRAADRALEHARSGKGPVFLLCETYRLVGHYVGDPQVYRAKEEVKELRENQDPLDRVRARLELSDEEDAAVEREVEELVEASVEFAQGRDRPQARGRPQERLCLTPLTGRRSRPAEPASAPISRRVRSARVPELSYREAVRDALSRAMREDEDVFIMGEDIAEMGGSMAVTQGMLAEFGPERVRNTPISEMAIVGAGIGAAMQGMRPIVEIMYEDFTTLAMEQIVNQAAKHRYMSGGQVKVPLTVRTQGGAGWSPGAQHAQQVEGWFVHVPGLKVVFASTPTDVRGLLWSSIYDDNTVIFFEHRILYPIKEEVPEELEPIPLGKARVHREGEDVTVVATGRLVHEALKAAEEAESEGVSVEVVDPRTLLPLDEETIVASVKKTNRCVVAHEAVVRMGFGAEVAAVVQHQAFDWLDAPIERVGSKFTPLPFAPVMEQFVVPHASDVLDAIRKTVGRST